MESSEVFAEQIFPLYIPPTTEPGCAEVIHLITKMIHPLAINLPPLSV